MKLTQTLIKIPLLFKIALLILLVVIIFVANSLLAVVPMPVYFLLFSSFILLLLWLAYFVLEKRTLRYIFKMWGLGGLIYLIIAIPRVYSGGMLTPYFVFTALGERWLYTLLLPQIVLAMLLLGLIFIRITSPVEFLRWRIIGPHIALLFRVLQQTEQVFYETKMALLMQNKWPEDKDKLFSFHDICLKLRYAPQLVAIVLRNIILYWLPWGWIYYKTRFCGRGNVLTMSGMLVIILAGLVAVLTLLGRIPLPATGGYLNLGDIGVVFCGLFLRGYAGMLAGGIGSAFADLISGFFVFMPITFVAKGVEALMVGVIMERSTANFWLLSFAGLSMVAIYFIAEVFLPGIGMSAAISELPFNLLQSSIGIGCGVAVYRLVNK